MKDIILFSTADWDNPNWSNKQHCAMEFVRRGYNVFYIESIGLRRPSMTRADSRRILRRIGKLFRQTRTICPGLMVWTPPVLPLQRFSIVRRLNRFLFSSFLSLHLRRYGIRRDVLWTYNPMTLDFVSADSFKELVYHCVDNVSAQPGMPASAMDRAEFRLVERADRVFVTANTLLGKWGQDHSKVSYHSNVADYEHFSKPDAPGELCARIEKLPRPRIGFVGAISDYKLDFPLLQELAERRPEWSFVLVGTVGEGCPWSNAEALKRFPNLHLMGQGNYAELPAVLHSFDVGILPLAINEYTRCVFPMKFYEYLAAGLPVVSTPLPTLKGLEEVVTLAGDAEGFVSALEQSLEDRPIRRGKGRELARQNTYATRMDRMLLELGW